MHSCGIERIFPIFLSSLIRLRRLVVPPGFEPGSPAPKAGMIDHYTTGLSSPHRAGVYRISSIHSRIEPIRYVGRFSTTVDSTNVPRGTSSRTTIGR